MNTFRKWNGKKIEDWGSVMSTDAKSFYRAFKNYLRREFPNAELIGFKPNHYDCSGFICQDGKYIYISHSIDRYKERVDFNDAGVSTGVLYRTAEGPKDYRGGKNNFCSINKLADCVKALFKIMEPVSESKISLMVNKILEGASVRGVIFNEAKSEISVETEESFIHSILCGELDEKKVHLNGSQWSKSGNCVIIVGGAGSGKGWIKDNFIAADFQQVFDVDKMKEMYVNLVKTGTIADDHGEYNFKNPDDVSHLHATIKGRGWDKSKERMMLTNKGNNKVLPNVLFDVTGREVSKLQGLGKQAKAMGYNVALIWVCTPREVAIIQNLTRDRLVRQDIFHSVHNNVKSSVIKFITELSENCDEAFLVLNPGKDLDALSDEQQAIANKYSVVKLDKSGHNFDLPDDIKNDIIKFLGKDEDVDNPSIYKDFDKIDVKQGPRGVLRK